MSTSTPQSSNSRAARKPGWSANRPCVTRYMIADRLKIVPKRLASLLAANMLDRDRLVAPFVAFLDALQLALEGLQVDGVNLPEAEALGLALEALALSPPAPGLPALSEIGLRRLETASWEVAYLDLDYQIQCRAGTLTASAAAFAPRFNAFLADALAKLDPVAA